MYQRTDDHGHRLTNRTFYDRIEITDDENATIRLAEPFADLTPTPVTAVQMSGVLIRPIWWNWRELSETSPDAGAHREPLPTLNEQPRQRHEPNTARQVRRRRVGTESGYDSGALGAGPASWSRASSTASSPGIRLVTAAQTIS